MLQVSIVGGIYFFSCRFYCPLVDIFECKVISVAVSDTVIVLEHIKFWNLG